MPSVSEMVEAVKETLEDMKTFKKVGDLPEWLKQDPEQQVIGVPAVYIYFEQATFEPTGVAGKFFQTTALAVILVTRAYSIDNARLLHETGNVPGAYDLVESVVNELKGKTLGLDIMPLMPVRVMALASNPQTAIFSIVFETRCRI